jgi:hypothetical protein
MKNIVRLKPGETWQTKKQAFRDRLMAGRHALNVEIEVRVLVPKLTRAGPTVPRRIVVLSPARAARHWTRSDTTRALTGE